MNKQNRETKTKRKRSPNGSHAIARHSICESHQPVSFARQLLAAPLRPFPVSSSSSRAARFFSLVMQRIQRLTKRLFKPQRRQCKLKLLEVQQLGEKRFVAIVRVGKQKFLIGGAATSVSLLAEINAPSTPVMAPRSRGQEMA